MTGIKDKGKEKGEVGERKGGEKEKEGKKRREEVESTYRCKRGGPRDS